MFHPSPEYSPSRPFKIFISLLDKWEIGSPLTEVLVFDAFRAVKQGVESGVDAGEEVGTSERPISPHFFDCFTQLSMTGSTMYEAVEPLALWKQLLRAVLSDICADDDRVEVLNSVTLSLPVR